MYILLGILFAILGVAVIAAVIVLHNRRLPVWDTERRDVEENSPETGGPKARKPGTATVMRHSRQRHAQGVPTLPLLSLGLVLLIAGGGMIGLQQYLRRPAPTFEYQPRPQSELVLMHRTGGRLLGDFVAQTFPGKRVLVLLAEPAATTPEDSSLYEGFLEKVSGQVELVEVTLPLGDSTAPPESGLWLTPEIVDEAIAGHSHCEVIFSLVGLPQHALEMTFWQSVDRPDIVLANAAIFLYKRLIVIGAIDAALVRRPWVNGEPEITEATDERNWLLITSANVEEISRKYRNLFLITGTAASTR